MSELETLRAKVKELDRQNQVLKHGLRQLYLNSAKRLFKRMKQEGEAFLESTVSLKTAI